MTGPRVSFVVTCFNLGAYLPEALASIRAQTFRDFDICVVDDGSTDAETLRVLAECGLDVTVVRSENRGLPAARNLGVSRTRGEFVCAVDADDILMPSLAERSVARLDADPSLAFVSHWFEAFGDRSWDWKPQRCDFPALLDSNSVNGAALVRRAALEAVGGWDEDFRSGLEDWDLWVTLVERGYRGDIIPEVLFRYRQRPDSMSRIHFAGEGHARQYRRLVDKHRESFRRHVAVLAGRRLADLASALNASVDVREALELHALPGLTRARDDLNAAERRRAHWEREQEAIEMDRRRHRAEEQVADLRASLSWRLTQPLRTLADLAIRAVGRRLPHHS